jgi:sporulation protein YlmC with PRC-barrel domain
MPRYDRYDDTHSRSRSGGRDERDYFDHGDDRDRGRGRGGGGMFGFGGGGHRDQREERGRFEERERGGFRDQHPRYGSDDRSGALPMDETSRLIASNKVEGTTVYGSDGHRLGTIFNFMVDKFSGEVEYAVMRYGGFMGLGERYYPLPWRVLSYDTRAGGYRIGLSERDLQNAPSFDRHDEPEFSRSYGDRVNRWYGVR